jgi:hypothetical protein
VRNNLLSWITGGTKSREERDTTHDWYETERLWEASIFGGESFEPALGRILEDLYDRLPRMPSAPVQLAMSYFIWDCIHAEPVGGLDPRWAAIQSSVEAAVEFRELIALRRRWCADFPQMFDAFKRVIVDTLEVFVSQLPEFCFEEHESERPDLFEVPLLDVLPEPHELIQSLFAMPYEANVLRLDLFKRLRAQSGVNLLIASGFQPGTPYTAAVQNRLRYPNSKDDEPPAQVADAYLRYLPARNLLDIPIPFRIPEEARFEHCHIVGGTGHGKTQLLQRMIYTDLLKACEDGRSVVVIDSQGDLINKLVRLDLFSPDMPDGLADRLVLIDPADVEFPAALNLFDAHLDRVRDYSAADRERVLNGVVELYEMFFGAFLGAELTQKQGVIFRYLARLMLAIPGATIHTLISIMEDGKPYREYIETLDGSARHFFESEFFHPSFTATKKQVIRRLWGVLSTPAFERMFAQRENKLDLFEAMNEGKIILVSTAKDLLKRDGSQLLGRFFIAMIMQAALERSTLPEYLRTPAMVYVDEAQEYFDDSIETILNQARKYRVGLTLAHQTLDQLSPGLRSAVLSNTSIKCAGGVSAKDARALASELHTTSEFIESMTRRGDRTEFALWVKQRAPQAIRLTVPLGFLERQATVDEDAFGILLDRNRARYCGTLADVVRPVPALPSPPVPRTAEPPAPVAEPSPAPVAAPRRADTPETREPVPRPAPEILPPRPEAREEGKGGRQHKYLQAMVKQLAEEQGLKAIIEAPLPGGQVDVLLERDGIVAAVEISVSTPVEHERENVRKCLDAGYPRIGVVLAKSKRTQGTYKAALTDDLSESERARISFLAPEDLPDFIAGLAPPPAETEQIVKGYKVKVSHVATSPEDRKARTEAISRVIAKSLDKRLG